MDNPMDTIRPHCDKCGFTGESVPVAKAREYLGCECPKCGHVMVTEEDCTKLEAVLAAKNAFEETLIAMGLACRPGEEPEGAETLVVTIEACTAPGSDVRVTLDPRKA